MLGFINDIKNMIKCKGRGAKSALAILLCTLLIVSMAFTYAGPVFAEGEAVSATESTSADNAGEEDPEAVAPVEENNDGGEAEGESGDEDSEKTEEKSADEDNKDNKTDNNTDNQSEEENSTEGKDNTSIPTDSKADDTKDSEKTEEKPADNNAVDNSKENGSGESEPGDGKPEEEPKDEEIKTPTDNDDKDKEEANITDEDPEIKAPVDEDQKEAEEPKADEAEGKEEKDPEVKTPEDSNEENKESKDDKDDDKDKDKEDEEGVEAGKEADPKEDEEKKDEEDEDKDKDEEEEDEDKSEEEKLKEEDPFNYITKYYVPDKIGRYAYPLARRAVITYYFAQIDELHTSYPHGGVDLAISMGTPVLAAENGIVTVAHAWDGTIGDGYGNYVDILHPDGNTTRYGHMSEINVKVGQIVIRGQQIGKVGSTGRSTGPHLHFEVITPKGKTDPLPFINGHDWNIAVEVEGKGGSVHIANSDGYTTAIHRDFENKLSYTEALGGTEVATDAEYHILNEEPSKTVKFEIYYAPGYKVNGYIKTNDGEEQPITFNLNDGLYSFDLKASYDQQIVHIDFLPDRIPISELMMVTEIAAGVGNEALNNEILFNEEAWQALVDASARAGLVDSTRKEVTMAERWEAAVGDQLREELDANRADGMSVYSLSLWSDPKQSESKQSDPKKSEAEQGEFEQSEVEQGQNASDTSDDKAGEASEFSEARNSAISFFMKKDRAEVLRRLTDRNVQVKVSKEVGVSLSETEKAYAIQNLIWTMIADEFSDNYDLGEHRLYGEVLSGPMFDYAEALAGEVLGLEKIDVNADHSNDIDTSDVTDQKSSLSAVVDSIMLKPQVGGTQATSLDGALDKENEPKITEERELPQDVKITFVYRDVEAVSVVELTEADSESDQNAKNQTEAGSDSVTQNGANPAIENSTDVAVQTGDANTADNESIIDANTDADTDEKITDTDSLSSNVAESTDGETVDREAADSELAKEQPSEDGSESATEETDAESIAVEPIPGVDSGEADILAMNKGLAGSGKYPSSSQILSRKYAKAQVSIKAKAGEEVAKEIVLSKSQAALLLSETDAELRTEILRMIRNGEVPSNITRKGLQAILEDRAEENEAIREMLARKVENGQSISNELVTVTQMNDLWVFELEGEDDSASAPGKIIREFK